MMNRYAELLFWAGRYMERVGNYARLIDVNYHMRHELYGHQDREYIWERLAGTTGNVRRFEELYDHMNAGTNELTALHFLTFEHSNNNSILACVRQARNNIRTLRQLVPVELWEIMNAFYIWLKDQNVGQLMLQSPHLFYQKVREWATLFGGAVDAVMIRGQEWEFLQAGKYVERVDNTLRIIYAVHRQLDRAPAVESHSYSCQRTVVLLKSLGGFEPFRRLHTADVTFEKAMEFMLTNGYFPHSARHALNAVEGHIERLHLQAGDKAAMMEAVSRLSDTVQSIAASAADGERAVTEADLSRLLRASGQLGQAAAAAFLSDCNVGA